MLDLIQPKHRTGVILGGAVVLAVVVGAILFAVQSPGPAPAPQQIHVSIIGNLGGTVMVDGGTPTRLDAYNGTDARDFTASKSISVLVDSSGMAPSCRIVDRAGKQLAAQDGASPSVVPQTMLQGYGPAKSIEAPTIESVTCEAQLG